MTNLKARAYNSVNQTATNGSQVPIAFDTNSYDGYGIHSTTVNNTRFTVPVGQGGDWLVWANGIWSNNATAGTRIFQINVNGAGSGSLTQTYGLTFQDALPISTVLVLNGGDYVELMAFQSTGVSVDILCGVGGTFMGMIRLF